MQSRLSLDQLQTSPLAVLGYGVNHEALVAWLLHQGLRFTIRDRDPAAAERFRTRHPDLLDFVTWETMPDVTRDLQAFKIVFRTPGIPLLDKGIQAAIKRGVTVTSQTELFLTLCPAPVVGVTGTKGKGTTCTLIYQMLKAGYNRGTTYLGGNIGADPFAFLPEVRPEDVVILELSSFQLEGLQQSPHIAVVLHVTEDHLEYHGTVAAYRAAKRPILEFQTKDDVAIINVEYPDMDFYRQRVVGRLYTYTRQRPGRQAAWVDEQGSEEVVFYQVDSTLGSFPITGRRLLGKHNLENILPATIVGALCGISSETMGKVVREFAGLEHRLMHVGTLGGVAIYDNSIATTPDSCAVSLDTFPGQRIHLLAGGSDKGQTYPDLAARMVRQCATVSLLPGKATPRLEKALRQALRAQRDCSLTLLPAPEGQDTPLGLMKAVLEQLRPHVQPGDVLLLSPSASGIGAGPFHNYKERGEAFVSAATAVLGREG